MEERERSETYLLKAVEYFTRDAGATDCSTFTICESQFIQYCKKNHYNSYHKRREFHQACQLRESPKPAKIIHVQLGDLFEDIKDQSFGQHVFLERISLVVLKKCIEQYVFWNCTLE